MQCSTVQCSTVQYNIVQCSKDGKDGGVKEAHTELNTISTDNFDEYFPVILIDTVGLPIKKSSN